MVQGFLMGPPRLPVRPSAHPCTRTGSSRKSVMNLTTKASFHRAQPVGHSIATLPPFARTASATTLKFLTSATKSRLCLASFLRPLLLRWLIRCQGHPAVQGSEPQRRMFSLALSTCASACRKPASVLRSSSIVSLILLQLPPSEYRSSQAFD